MGTLPKIAFRNILRNKRRTFFSAITIAGGLLVLIFMDSVMVGMNRAGIDNLIDLTTSSVKLNTKEYYEHKKSLPLKYGIKKLSEIKDFLQNESNAKGITPRTKFLGELSNYSESIPVQGTVIAPQTDKQVFTISENIIGKYFSRNSQNEIIMGKTLARDLNVETGDYITLYARTKYDTHNADEFEIIGLLNTSDPNINKNSVIITYTAGNNLLDLNNLITEINISFERTSQYEKLVSKVNVLKEKLEKHFPHLYVMTFLDMGASFLEIAKQKKVFGFVFIIVILIIAAVGIFNSVLMSVYERVREIGILLAHGLSRFEITFLFMWEGLIIGFLGSSLGILLGMILNYFLVTNGMAIDKMAKGIDMGGIPIWGTIYGTWNIGLMIFAFLFGIFVSVIASIIPAAKPPKCRSIAY